jgi:ParB family transcriptional regulator, chromosome partitioning protein
LKQEIVYKSVKELVPYARNSRTHSDEQVAQIMASIKEFGFTNPVLTDGDNGIIAGHGRVMAAQRIGLEEVPTIELSHLTDAQKKAYIIADNKIALNSGWDEDLLQLELIELDEMEFNYSELGFDFGFNDNQDVEEIEIDLPSGDREPIRNMTFTVSDEQHELIEEVLKLAKEYPLHDPAGINENSNGNALYYICEMFNNKVNN